MLRKRDIIGSSKRGLSLSKSSGGSGILRKRGPSRLVAAKSHGVASNAPLVRARVKPARQASSVESSTTSASVGSAVRETADGRGRHGRGFGSRKRQRTPAASAVEPDEVQALVDSLYSSISGASLQREASSVALYLIQRLPSAAKSASGLSSANPSEQDSRHVATAAAQALALMRRSLLGPVRRAAASFHALQAASHEAQKLKSAWDAAKSAAEASHGHGGGADSGAAAADQSGGRTAALGSTGVDSSDAALIQKKIAADPTVSAARARAIEARRRARRHHGMLQQALAARRSAAFAVEPVVEAILRAAAWLLPAALRAGHDCMDQTAAAAGQSAVRASWLQIALSLLLACYHLAISCAPLVCLQKRRGLRVLAGLLPLIGPAVGALEERRCSVTRTVGAAVRGGGKRRRVEDAPTGAADDSRLASTYTSSTSSTGSGGKAAAIDCTEQDSPEAYSRSAARLLAPAAASLSRAMGGSLPPPSLMALLVLRRATAGAVPGADDDDEACHVLAAGAGSGCADDGTQGSPPYQQQVPPAPPRHAPDRVLVSETSVAQWSSLSLQLQRGLRAQVLGASAGGGGAVQGGGASNALQLAAGLVRELEASLGESAERDALDYSGRESSTGSAEQSFDALARLRCLRGVLALRLLEAATYGEQARGNSLAVAATVLVGRSGPVGSVQSCSGAPVRMESDRARSLISVLLGVTCLAGRAQRSSSWSGWKTLPIEAELLALRVLSNATHHCPAAAAAVPMARPEAGSAGRAAAAVLVPTWGSSRNGSGDTGDAVPIDMREWPVGTRQLAAAERELREAVQKESGRDDLLAPVMWLDDGPRDATEAKLGLSGKKGSMGAISSAGATSSGFTIQRAENQDGSSSGSGHRLAWSPASRRRLCGWGIRVLLASALRHASEVVGGGVQDEEGESTESTAASSGVAEKKRLTAHDLAAYDTLVLALSVLANTAEGSLAARAAIAAAGVPSVAAPWMRAAALKAQIMVDPSAYSGLQEALDGSGGASRSSYTGLGPGYRAVPPIRDPPYDSPHGHGDQGVSKSSGKGGLQVAKEEQSAVDVTVPCLLPLPYTETVPAPAAIVCMLLAAAVRVGPAALAVSQESSGSAIAAVEKPAESDDTSSRQAVRSRGDQQPAMDGDYGSGGLPWENSDESKQQPRGAATNSSSSSSSSGNGNGNETAPAAGVRISSQPVATGAKPTSGTIDSVDLSSQSTEQSLIVGGYCAMLLLLLCRGNGAAWSVARAALPKQSHEVLTRLGSLRPLAGSLLLWRVWQGQVGVLTTEADDLIRKGLAEVAALERGLGSRSMSQARSRVLLTEGRAAMDDAEESCGNDSGSGSSSSKAESSLAWCDPDYASDGEDAVQKRVRLGRNHRPAAALRPAGHDNAASGGTGSEAPGLARSATAGGRIESPQRRRPSSPSTPSSSSRKNARGSPASTPRSKSPGNKRSPRKSPSGRPSPLARKKVSPARRRLILGAEGGGSPRPTSPLEAAAGAEVIEPPRVRAPTSAGVAALVRSSSTGSPSKHGGRGGGRGGVGSPMAGSRLRRSSPLSAARLRASASASASAVEKKRAQQNRVSRQKAGDGTVLGGNSQPSALDDVDDSDDDSDEDSDEGAGGAAAGDDWGDAASGDGSPRGEVRGSPGARGAGLGTESAPAGLAGDAGGLDDDDHDALGVRGSSRGRVNGRGAPGGVFRRDHSPRRSSPLRRQVSAPANGSASATGPVSSSSGGISKDGTAGSGLYPQGMDLSLTSSSSSRSSSMGLDLRQEGTAEEQEQSQSVSRSSSRSRSRSRGRWDTSRRRRPREPQSKGRQSSVGRDSVGSVGSTAGAGANEELALRGEDEKNAGEDADEDDDDGEDDVFALVDRDIDRLVGGASSRRGSGVRGMLQSPIGWGGGGSAVQAVRAMYSGVRLMGVQSGGNSGASGPAAGSAGLTRTGRGGSGSGGRGRSGKAPSRGRSAGALDWLDG